MRKNKKKTDVKEMEELWFANDDLSVDVLSRLPIKTLLKLKCVSKEWHRLIVDRSFIQIQLKSAEAISGFFFQERFQWCNDDIKHVSYIPVDKEDAQVMSNILDFLPESVVILASSYGLICCRSCFSSSHPVVYICNPSNKKWVNLPFPAGGMGKSLALAFDPIRYPVEDSSNFKVVNVCQTLTDTEDSCFSFDVYSSGTGVWKRLEEVCNCKHNLFKCKGIFIAGIMYWLTDGDQILMFDLENELSWLITLPLPAASFNSIPEMCIGESKGQLHYVLISEDGLQLWVLEDHFASQWAPEYAVSLDKLEEENPQFLYKISERVAGRLTIDMIPWVNPLAFSDGLLLVRVSADIYSYHFEKRKLTKLCNLSVLGQNSIFAPTVIPYAMSLVPLDRA